VIQPPVAIGVAMINTVETWFLNSIVRVLDRRSFYPKIQLFTVMLVPHVAMHAFWVATGFELE
jgi:hypothetical protein